VKTASLTGDAEALRAFWAVFHARAGERRCAHRTRYSRWREIGSGDLFASQYVTRRSIGVFLRGPLGERWRVTAARLEPVRDCISEVLDADLGEEFLFPTRRILDTYDDRRWIEMADWLHREADRYVQLLSGLTLPAPSHRPDLGLEPGVEPGPPWPSLTMVRRVPDQRSALSGMTGAVT
jgi:hypothetical protein